MTQTQIQAGSSVESQCKKCKTVTDHHVVVMDGDKIAKVECKVCGGRHAYKSPKEVPAEPKVRTAAPRTPRQSATQKKQSATVQALWEKSVNAAAPMPYSMTGNFKAGDVINHPTFGLGAVQKFMRPNTIEVLFQDSLRNLRCGGGR